MRLIDADPIMKFIQDGLNEKDPQKHIGYDGIRIMTEIEYAPTVQSAPVWTACSEGIPDSGKKYSNRDPMEYLVEVVDTECGDYQQRHIATFEGGTWLTQSGDEFEDYETVIAWKPLPEPYNPNKAQEARADGK